MKIGIMIPVKYHRVVDPSGGMDPREGNIGENARFAAKRASVYWDLNILTDLRDEEARNKRGITFPTCCYFYDADRTSLPVGARVTYKAKLLAACSLEDLKNKKEEHEFIPEWRTQCFEGRWSRRNSWVERERPDLEGRAHQPSIVWIKIKDFDELSPPLKVNDFRKWDGSNLEGVRGAYIKCPIPI